MKRAALIGLMVAVAVGVGVLVAWAASFPEGISTPHITLTLPGIGEGGEMAIQGDVGKITFDGLGIIECGNGQVMWSRDSNDLSQLSGILSGPTQVVAPNVTASYCQIMGSTGMTAIGADTGFIVAGKFSQDSEPADFDGVSILSREDGSSPCYEPPAKSMLHVGATGGLNETGWSPSVEMVTLAEPPTADPCNDQTTLKQTASLSLRGNDTEGEIVLANYKHDAGNAVNASITVSKSGSVIVQLGGDISGGGGGGSPSPPGGGDGGNTEGMHSGFSAQSLATASNNATAAEQAPAHPALAVPRINVGSVLNHVLGQ